MSIVFLNGKYLPREQAKISVLDRGFIFADGVYEVLPVYNHKMFRLAEHLQRLENSLEMIHIRNPHTNAEWSAILEELIEKNEGKNQSIYLQVTRGVAERDHIFDENMEPTVFAMSRALPDGTKKDGVAAITHEDTRWKYCNIKSIALLPGVLLRYEAHKKSAREAILLRDGFVTEGAASNVFIVKNNIIVTPPKDNKILPGVTRDLVAELAKSNELHFQEREISAEELALADEIWITSSTQEIVPVVKLDGKVIGNGVPGLMWEKMNNIYQVFKNTYSG